MKVYFKMRDGAVAKGEYDFDSKQLVVLKGSAVSKSVCHPASFRGAKLIEQNRKNSVKNGKVIKDITFTSASTAANFVTGYSTNGLISWKDENGRKLKDIIAEQNNA